MPEVIFKNIGFWRRKRRFPAWILSPRTNCLGRGRQKVNSKPDRGIYRGHQLEESCGGIKSAENGKKTPPRTTLKNQGNNTAMTFNKAKSNKARTGREDPLGNEPE